MTGVQTCALPISENGKLLSNSILSAGCNIRDNRTGTQGPPGPPGPASTVPGPQGPQGIPGPNNITTTKIYKQFGPLVTSVPIPSTTPTLFIANSTVTCLPGDVVLSGGYRLGSSNFAIPLTPVQVLTESRPTEDG